MKGMLLLLLISWALLVPATLVQQRPKVGHWANADTYVDASTGHVPGCTNHAKGVITGITAAYDRATGHDPYRIQKPFVPMPKRIGASPAPSAPLDMLQLTVHCANPPRSTGSTWGMSDQYDILDTAIPGWGPLDIECPPGAGLNAYRVDAEWDRNVRRHVSTSFSWQCLDEVLSSDACTEHFAVAGPQRPSTFHPSYHCPDQAGLNALNFTQDPDRGWGIQYKCCSAKPTPPLKPTMLIMFPDTDVSGQPHPGCAPTSVMTGWKVDEGTTTTHCVRATLIPVPFLFPLPFAYTEPHSTNSKSFRCGHGGALQSISMHNNALYHYDCKEGLEATECITQPAPHGIDDGAQCPPHHLVNGIFDGKMLCCRHPTQPIY